MKKKLTALAIPGLPEGQYPDSLTPGLILKVGSGRKTWVCRYRRGGKRHADRLGFSPAMSLLQAREAASALLKRVEAGLTPRPAAEEIIHPQSPDMLTLGKLIDRYEKLRRKEARKTKTLDAAMATLRKHLADYLTVPASQFSKADLRAARDKVAEYAPIQANRLLAYLGPVLKWASSEDLILHSFVGDLRKGPERKRSRVLTRDEIAAIWDAAGKLDGGGSAPAFGRMTKFLLLTAQRRDEAASLLHGHILDGTWKQDRNKADRPHRLKLSEMALQLIGTGEAKDLCFSGVSGKLSGFGKLKRKLDEKSGVSGWVLHDLRRTAATAMQDLGVDEMAIKGVLNHAIPGVSGVYLRSTLEKQKAEALQLWADEVARITGVKRAVL